MPSQVNIMIDKKGNASIVNVSGLGMTCMNATAKLEKILGVVDESSRELTDNFFMVELIALENAIQNQ